MKKLKKATGKIIFLKIYRIYNQKEVKFRNKNQLIGI